MPLEEFRNWNIILASASPRRSELLAGLDLEFVVRVKETDETIPGDLHREEIALHLARKKAELFDAEVGDRDIIITADTIVLVDGMVLGKPASKEEAREMLRQLSGRSHEVITAVAILTGRGLESFYSETLVRFAELDEREILYYVDRFAPYDKAGAYGIQEWIGMVGVESIEGSYFNVMGLPVRKLYSRLKEIIRDDRPINK